MTTATIERQPLTARQQDVLDWITGFIDVHGFSPTIRQIASHYGWTVNGVMCHLRPLRRKGAVTWLDGHCRTLRVVEVAK